MNSQRQRGSPQATLGHAELLHAARSAGMPLGKREDFGDARFSGVTAGFTGDFAATLQVPILPAGPLLLG